MLLDIAFPIVPRADDTTDPNAEESQYGYTPTRIVCIVIVAAYTISTFLHIFQAIRYRAWWPLPTVLLAGILEIAGWGARLWSSYDDTLDTPYMIQIVTTIIGPTPFLAANFMIFGALVRILGPSYSRLSPRLYSLIFVSCDVVSLVVQGAGGGMAASGDTVEQATNGGHIMLVGIIFQLVMMTLFFLLAGEFFYRLLNNAPHPSSHGPSVSVVSYSQPTVRVAGYTMGRDILTMVIALGAMTVCLYIRAVYRTIELADGWHGIIIETEWYFDVFDGAMVVIAFWIMNIFHPGRLLGRDGMSAKKSVKDIEHMEMGNSTTSLVPPTRPARGSTETISVAPTFKDMQYGDGY